MKNKKKILVVILLVVILIGGGIAGFYWYDDTYFVSTDDARLAANIVNVTPQIPGRITSWNVSEGQTVQSGDALGWQDTNAVANSSGVSTGSSTLPRKWFRQYNSPVVECGGGASRKNNRYRSVVSSLRMLSAPAGSIPGIRSEKSAFLRALAGRRSSASTSTASAPHGIG